MFFYYFCLSYSFVTLIIFLLGYLTFHLYRYFTFWERQSIRGYRFIDCKGLFQEHNEYTLDMFKKFGKIYGGFMFFKKYITINDPELIREVFVKCFNCVPNHTDFNIGPSPKVNRILFFMPGDDNWKRIRSIITPAFSSGKLKAMMSSISFISDKFVQSLEQFVKSGEVFDIRKHFGAFAMDVISSCGYGIDIDSVNNPDHPIMVNAKKVLSTNANFNMILSIILPKLAKFFKLNFFDINAINFFDKLFNDIAKRRMNSSEEMKNEQGKRRTDFIQLMLDYKKSEEDFGYDSQSEEKDNISAKPVGSLSADELTAQGILFFIAGYDTTSSVLSHLAYYLSVNKDCQQRLYEELKDVKEFSNERLSQIKYLNAVIDETLRLAPPILRVQRQGSQDVEIAGIRIPAGTSIDVLPYALHRDPDLWPDPLEFKPERFLEPRHHPWAYMPFGGGPRICLGKRFALQEMRMCCAKLFRNYQVDLSPGFKLEYFIGNIILIPKSVMVTLKSR